MLRQRLNARARAAYPGNPDWDRAAREFGMTGVDEMAAAAARQPGGTLMLRSDRLTPAGLADKVLAAAWLACNGNPFEVLGPNGLEVDSMTVTMIPDQPGRAAAFEPLLDDLLPVFCPGWGLPQTMAGEHQHHRCEVKRFRLGEARGRRP